MANVGTIAYQLSVNPFGLTKGLETASRNLTNFAAGVPKALQRQTNAVTGVVLNPIQGFLGGVRNLLSSLPFIGTAFAAIPVSGAEFISFLKEGMASVRELGKLSQSTGVSTRMLGGLMLLTGGETELLQVSLFKLNDKLGQISQGNKATGRVFAGLGLDGAALAAMPADKALGAVADRIKSLPTPAERAHAAIQLLGEGGVKLLPALMKGSAGMEEAIKKAKEMGLSFSEVDAAKVGLAQKALSQAGLAVKGLQTQLAIQLAPFIQAAAEWFNSLALSGVNMGDMVANAVHGVASAIGFVLDSVEAIRFGWDLVTIGVKLWYAATVAAIADVLDALGKLPEKLGGGKFSSWASDMHAKSKQLYSDAKSDANSVKERLGGLSASQKVEQTFNKIKASAEKAGQAAINATKGDGKALAYYEKIAALQEKGVQLAKDMATPYEKFQTSLAEYNELLQANAISWDTYSRAVGKATDELSKAAQIGESKGPEAVLSGSKEAFSAQARFEREGARGSPQERMANLLQEALTVNRLQLQASRDTAQAIQSLTTGDL